jgi:hypothetical protein
MPKISLIGPSSQGRTSDADPRRALNLYPHKSEGGKHPWNWVGTPGTSLATALAAVARGSHVWNSKVYLVCGTGLYSWDGTTLSASLGTLASSSGNVSMAHSRTQLVIVDGGARVYTYDGTTFTTVSNFASYVTLDSTNTIVVNTNVATVTTTSSSGAATSDPVFIAGHSDTSFNGWWTITGTPTTTSFTFAITKANGTYNSSSATASVGTDTLTITPERVAFMDGYFVFSNGQVYYSVPDDGGTLTASRFLVAQRDPDAMLTPWADRGNLILFGSLSTEIWYNPGTSTTDPFEPARSAAIPWGIVAPWSVAQFGGGIIWVGSKNNSNPVVVFMEGYDPNVVSSPALEYALKAAYSNVATATAYSYMEEGHEFYCLTFGTATWVYDLETKLWHERSTSSGAHCGKWYAYLGGKHLVTDKTYGNLLEMNLSTTSDYVNNAAANISRLGQSGSIQGDDATVVHRRFHLDMLHPEASSFWGLAWSDDGGHNWTSPIQKSARGAGNRVEWYRLGAAKTSRIYRVTSTSRAQVYIMGAYLDADVE